LLSSGSASGEFDWRLRCHSLVSRTARLPLGRLGYTWHAVSAANWPEVKLGALTKSVADGCLLRGEKPFLSRFGIIGLPRRAVAI